MSQTPRAVAGPQPPNFKEHARQEVDGRDFHLQKLIARVDNKLPNNNTDYRDKLFEFDKELFNQYVEKENAYVALKDVLAQAPDNRQVIEMHLEAFTSAYNELSTVLELYEQALDAQDNGMRWLKNEEKDLLGFEKYYKELHQGVRAPEELQQPTQLLHTQITALRKYVGTLNRNPADLPSMILQKRKEKIDQLHKEIDKSIVEIEDIQYRLKMTIKPHVDPGAAMKQIKTEAQRKDRELAGEYENRTDAMISAGSQEVKPQWDSTAYQEGIDTLAEGVEKGKAPPSSSVVKVVSAISNATPTTAANGEVLRTQAWPDPQEEMIVAKSSEELEGLTHFDISELAPGKVLEMSTVSGNVYRLSIRTEANGSVHKYLFNQRQGTEIRADHLPLQVTLGKSFLATQVNLDNTYTRTDSSPLAKIQIVDEVAASSGDTDPSTIATNGEAWRTQTWPDPREEMVNAVASEKLEASLLKDSPPPLSTEEQEKARVRAEQFAQKVEADKAFKVAEAAYYTEANNHAVKQAKLGETANYWGAEATPSAEFLATEQAFNAARNNRRKLFYERTDPMVAAKVARFKKIREDADEPAKEGLLAEHEASLDSRREKIHKGMASVMYVKQKENLHKIKVEALAAYGKGDALIDKSMRQYTAVMGKLRGVINNAEGNVSKGKLAVFAVVALGGALATVPVWATGALIGAVSGFGLRYGVKAGMNRYYVKAKETEVGIKQTEAETITQIRNIDIAEQIKAMTAEHKKLDARKRTTEVAAFVSGAAAGVATAGVRIGFAEQINSAVAEAFSPTPQPLAPAVVVEPAPTSRAAEALRAIAEEAEGRGRFPDAVTRQPETPPATAAPTPTPVTPRLAVSLPQAEPLRASDPYRQAPAPDAVPPAETRLPGSILRPLVPDDLANNLRGLTVAQPTEFSQPRVLQTLGTATPLEVAAPSAPAVVRTERVFPNQVLEVTVAQRARGMTGVWDNIMRDNPDITRDLMPVQRDRLREQVFAQLRSNPEQMRSMGISSGNLDLIIAGRDQIKIHELLQLASERADVMRGATTPSTPLAPSVSPIPASVRLNGLREINLGIPTQEIAERERVLTRLFDRALDDVPRTINTPPPPATPQGPIVLPRIPEPPITSLPGSINAVPLQPAMSVVPGAPAAPSSALEAIAAGARPTPLVEISNDLASRLEVPPVPRAPGTPTGVVGPEIVPDPPVPGSPRAVESFPDPGLRDQPPVPQFGVVPGRLTGLLDVVGDAESEPVTIRRQEVAVAEASAPRPPEVARIEFPPLTEDTADNELPRLIERVYGTPRAFAAVREDMIERIVPSRSTSLLDLLFGNNNNYRNPLEMVGDMTIEEFEELDALPEGALEDALVRERIRLEDFNAWREQISDMSRELRPADGVTINQLINHHVLRNSDRYLRPTT